MRSSHDTALAPSARCACSARARMWRWSGSRQESRPGAPYLAAYRIADSKLTQLTTLAEGQTITVAGGRRTDVTRMRNTDPLQSRPGARMSPSASSRGSTPETSEGTSVSTGHCLRCASWKRPRRAGAAPSGPSRPESRCGSDHYRIRSLRRNREWHIAGRTSAQNVLRMSCERAQPCQCS